MNLIKSYNKYLDLYPLLTKSITTGTMFGLGDVFSQVLIDKRQKLDYRRVGNMTFTGFFIASPMLHVWYTKAGPMVTSLLQKRFSKNISTFLQVFMDQTMFAPFLLSTFFICMPMVDKRSIKEGIEKGKNDIKNNLWPTMITNWKVWPAVHILTYTVIPVQHRVLYVNFVGLFWNMYLSYMLNLEENTQ